MIWGGADVIIIVIEIKFTINVLCLNHPKTIPPPLVCGKIVFHGTGPWCQKIQDLCFRAWQVCIRQFVCVLIRQLLIDWIRIYLWEKQTALGFNMPACVLSHFRCVQLYATLSTVARQAPLSMWFSRQEYWSRLPCPSPGDLPDPGFEPRSPALQADSLPSEPLGKPWGLA